MSLDRALVRSKSAHSAINKSKPFERRGRLTAHAAAIWHKYQGNGDEADPESMGPLRH
jgi:hypothetical protein